MNALDSPVEVLALDYLSFGLLTVVNNVWTWVAVITAAVSVWRIRSSSPRYQFPSEGSLIKPAPAVSPSPVERLAVAREPAAPTPAKVETPRRSPSPSLSPCVFNSEGRTSGKFTVFYDRDQEVEEDANVERKGDVDGEDENGERKSGRARDCWEATMEMRMGNDIGFYRYQDLTMLDGNVVRLWDGCRRRNVINAAPRIRCGGCDC